MPRKKLTPNDVPPAETASPQTGQAPQAAQAPKRRGRPPKNSVPVTVAPAATPSVEAAAAPRRRGRPPKVKTEPAVAAAPVAPELVTPSAPKRRGRPPKSAQATVPPLVAETPAAAPKRRGRPPKSATPVVALKPSTATPVAEAPRRGRGRPPKVKPAVETPVAAATAVPSADAPRRRGRPPKAKVQPPVEAAPLAANEIDLGDGRLLAVTFRARSGAAAPDAKPVAAPSVTTETPSSDEPLPAVTFRRREGKAPAPIKEPTESKPEPLDIPGLDDDVLPMISWRPKGDVPLVGQEEEAPEESSEFESAEESERGGRRRRRRRGRGGREELVADDETEETVEAVAPTLKSKSAEKMPIAIPSDAPQVILRNGVPVLVRDRRAFPPIALGGDVSDPRRLTNVLEEIRMAGNDGVHLHLLRLAVEVDATRVEPLVETVSKLLDQVERSDSAAQVILRLVFVAPRDADRRFADAIYRSESGRTAEPSVCDDEYWGEATKLVTGLIQGLGQPERLMGIMLDRPEGWEHVGDSGYDTSRSATQKFRAWARTRYGNDVVALRAAWFSGSVRFDNLEGPDAHEARQTADRFIRAGRRQRRTVDYHLFLSDATAARIGELAYAVKAASQGRLLVGVEYGGTLEGSHPAAGHLALGKVLRTPEIDFVAGPPSYSDREPGASAAFPSPVDSFPLNGKLYLSLEDYRTSLGGGHQHHPADLPGDPVLRTPQSLESVHWRGVGAALAHGMGVVWSDREGEGSLRTHSVWDRAARVREALTLRATAELEAPEVAVFIDERALAYLVDGDAFRLLVKDVRESIMRAGVSAAFYLLSDLAHREKFPDSKLYVFLNAWDIRPELRAAVKNRLQRDGKVLTWIYAAGLFDAGRESLERVREITGIALKPQPFASKAGTTLINRRHPLTAAFPDRTLSGNAGLEPTYFAIPEDATVLGEYTQTGLPSFVIRDFGGGESEENRWTSVFLGEPAVTPALVRSLAQLAGAHVWDFSDDVVHVRPPFLTVHCKGTGQRTVALPDKHVAYDLVSREYMAVDGANLRFIGVDGATHSFLVGPRAEVEHLLSTDPTTALTVETLPDRELNVRKDASDFDVPIMKLGEWIDSAEGDEVADEWFLRPGPVADEVLAPVPAQAEESEGQVGKRRRRRRGRGGGGGGSREDEPVGESQTFTAPNEEFGISVVFRKRE